MKSIKRPEYVLFRSKMNSTLLFGVFFCVCLNEGLLADQNGHSRQKRCIVVQKQSGTHGDSTEGEEDRGSESKDRDPHSSHKRRGGGYGELKTRDVEEIQPERLQYKILPKINDAKQRARNRLYTRVYY